MNFKVSREGYMGGLRGGSGREKCNYNTYKEIKK